MMLPSGWVAYDTSEKTEQDLLAQARARLMPQHQVALQGMLEAHVARAMQAARDNGAILTIMPGSETPDALFATASMIATVREATEQYSLDDVVVDIIQRRGGQSLDENKRIVRWTEAGKAQISGEDVGAYSVFYLTPVPGSSRRRALQFALTVAHPPEIDIETDEVLAGWVALVDAHVATFRWSS